jgi:uncharacterized membrane protein
MINASFMYGVATAVIFVAALFFVILFSRDVG